MQEPALRIAVTGGAGQLAYQLLFRIASGELFGKGRPIVLQILEVPEALPALEGVKMELQDCAFPELISVETTSDARLAFRDADFALLVGAKPRGPGMERRDLLQENAKIFVEQGSALNDAAKKDVKVFVIGNPCNTNCLIAMSRAPRLLRKNFYSMTRLDQNRASFLLAEKAKVHVKDASHALIWGNHSSTLVPDFFHARIQGRAVLDAIPDRHWLENEFFALVQNRGAYIIKLRGKSSAASAAQAILDAVKDIIHPTPAGLFFSSGVDSTSNPYGIAEGLVFSFPCRTTEKGIASVVPGLDIPEFLKAKLKLTERELLEERDCIRSLIT